MLKKINFTGRFSVLLHFIFWFLITSQLLRLVLFIWQYDEVSWSPSNFLRTMLTGLFFDLGTVTFVSLAAVFYYVLIPDKWIGSWVDKFLVWTFTSLMLFILIFTFFAELTFWDEFKTRFNFIAVDYLIYTHEVVSNIEQSYPLPLLVGGVVLITSAILFLFYKRNAFKNTFSYKITLRNRAVVLSATLLVSSLYIAFIANNQAEWSSNRYNSEISKSGIYSFFAAFRNNQMKYEDFYTSLKNDQAFSIIRSKLSSPDSKFRSNGYSIHRTVTNSIPSNQKKNVVFILVESLSGSFLKEFGNKENITPFMDSLAQKSIFFKNLYATGTRTVRGMEAVTLCIPPTPGQSIVKRPENQNLYTVCSVFKAKQYDCNFFYGGDGYFDNMNSYFGGNGFNIYDRGRGSVLSDKIKTARNNIDDSEVTFENAWGICDEDIFNKMLKVADNQYNFEERALMGTYRKLVLMKKEKVMILSDQKKEAFYTWNKNDNSLKPLPMDKTFLDETIAWYQTADYLFTNKLLQ